MHHLTRIDLRRLILTLATVSVILTLVNALYATYKVQKNLLIDGTLTANQAYATKLARSAAMHLNLVISELHWSSRQLSKAPQDIHLSQQETQRLLQQSETFNAVIHVNAQGELNALAVPEYLKADVIMKNAPIQKALNLHKTRISSPFQLDQSYYYILISQPIVDQTGKYQGFIGGLINLHDHSILHRLLSRQTYQDETHLYVVNAKQRLIVHPDENRIGEEVHGNLAIEAVLKGETNHQIITNSKGIEMLSGYSPVGIAGWGVVSQRPLEATLASLNEQMKSVFWHSLPILLITGLLIWLFAGRISKPLWHLARQAEHLETQETQSEVKQIKTWYYEADEIKTALLRGLGTVNQHISELKTESLTDPLTKILNRRGLDEQMHRWKLKNIPFSVISLDIDHFKTVNDAYGHDVGDHVIQAVTEQMRECSRSQDVLCRTGGEEFLMILPYTPLEQATQAAERLRKTMSKAPLKTVGTITISLGVAHWPETADDIEKVLKQADIALYQAKQTGRNKVCVATDTDCQEAMRKWEDILN